MKIKLTNHSIKRRNNLEETPKEYIIQWIKYFIDKFNISSLKNGKYKIISSYRSVSLKKYKSFCVFSKENEQIVIITFVNYKEENKELIKETAKLEITDINKTDIYRINKNNDKVKCGLVKQKDKKIEVYLDKTLNDKYAIFKFKGKIMFDDIKEIEKFCTYNEKSKHYLLNKLERINEDIYYQLLKSNGDNKIYLKRQQGDFICGKLDYKSKLGSFSYNFIKKYRNQIKIKNSIKEIKPKELDNILYVENNKIYLKKDLY